MRINSPCCITSRLMAGIKIGDGYVSIGYAARPGDDGRTRYVYHIDAPGLEHTGDDLQSGCQGGRLQSGLESLLCFLANCGESYAYRTRTSRDRHNADLFPTNVAEWCYLNAEELSVITSDLENTSHVIDE